MADVQLDNTLEGARAANTEFNTYRINEKGQKAALRAEVVALAGNLDRLLSASSHGRPAFAPEEGLSLEVINSKWDELQTAENEKAKKLQDELDRQEKLASLLRRLDGDLAVSSLCVSLPRRRCS